MFNILKSSTNHHLFNHKSLKFSSILKSQFNLISRNQAKSIDRSKVPKLDEKDLEENFINGSGPGGQNVNKRINCCQLRHKPTNLIVKCHEFRDLESNRKEARKLLLTKLDNHLNGEQSVEAQKKRIAIESIQKNKESLKLKRDKKLKLKEHLKHLEEKEEQTESNEVDHSKEIELIKQLDLLDELKKNPK